MSSPQIENGYTRIAHEIFEALADSRFYIPVEVRRIIDVILRKTYGFNKKEDKIALSQFQAITKMPKSHICRAINRAIQLNIVTRAGNGNEYKYRFNKDYSSWKSLPRQVIVKSLPEQVIGITRAGNESLPEQGTTIDNKETNTKDNKVFSETSKTMYPIKSEHAEDLPEFDAFTGEYKTSHKKPTENKKWLAFIPYWKSECFKHRGVEVEISLVKDKSTFHRISKKYDRDHMEEIITYFLKSDKSKEHLTITACFSADTINSFHLKK